MQLEKEHKKATLMSWTKAELVEYIMCLEHNNNALQESFDIQYKNCLNLINLTAELKDRHLNSKKLAAGALVTKE